MIRYAKPFEDSEISIIPDGKIPRGWIEVTAEEFEAHKVLREKERLNMLSLTAADVERAIYQAKGIDFEDILELVSQQIVTSSQQGDEYSQTPIDLKALKIELKANNFYRGNPYVNTIGNLLGFTPADLDYLFEHKKFPLEVTDAGMVL